MTWIEILPGTEPPRPGGVPVVTRYGEATYGDSVYGGQTPALTWTEVEQ